MRTIHKLSVPALSLVVVASLSVPVLAVVPNAHANQVTTTISEDNSSGNNGAAGKQKACENRQKAIDNILGRIVTRGQKQLDLFSTIATRVEDFATTKNAKPSNYDALVAKLDTDKTSAQSDLAAMKTNETLDCTVAEPKATVTAFQADLKKEIADLKTYKTDVKDLIVAVKTSLGQSTAQTENNNGNTGNNSGNTGGGQQ